MVSPDERVGVGGKSTGPLLRVREAGNGRPSGAKDGV
jgi:hypothetical protein